ncbi:MAG: glycoside hydrolase family 20 zincin-like fold domain-containing protein, partial [Gemmatimonadales bacterium]
MIHNSFRVLVLGGLVLFPVRTPAQTGPVPIPVELRWGSGAGAFELTPRSSIVLDLEDSVTASRFRRHFETILLEDAELEVPIHTGPGREEATIALGLDPDSGSPESYRLTVGPDTVRLTAPDEAGLFRGLQTLRQLIEQANGQRAFIPTVTIEDEPRFTYRGMHLDVGRHFFPVSFVKRYIDLLARYKFNTFHWHLTEDQG